MGNDTKHKPIGGSDYQRTRKCSGSIYMKRILPSPPAGEKAEEGTLFHAVVEKVLSDFLLEDKNIFEAYNLYKGECADEEMQQHVIDDCLAVQRLLLQIGTENIERIALEKEMLFGEYAFGGVGGPADLAVIARSKQGHRVLIIWDHKYGKNAVEVEEDGHANEQLAFYAACGDRTAEWGPVDRAVVYIYQPRVEHPDGPLRMVKLSREDLDFWAADIEENARKVEAEFESQSPTFCPGEHCRWCRADGQCAGQLKQREEECELEFAPVPVEAAPALPPVLTLTDRQKEALVFRAKELEAFFAQVKAVVLEEMLAGKEYPRLKLVRGKADRVFKDEAEAAAKLEEMGIDPWTKKLKGITAITKEIGKKKAEEFAAEYMEKPEGSLQVAPITDRRAAVVLGSDVEAEFAEVEE